MAFLQLNSWVHRIGEDYFSPFVRDGSAPFCNFRLGFEKDHLKEWGFQVSVCRWAAQQVWPVPQWHSQLHCAASHLQSTSVSAHPALLPMASLRAGEWGEVVEEEMFFAFYFVPLPCLFCKGLWQSASRGVQCRVWNRLSLQVASCHGDRSPNNLKCREKLWYLNSMEDCESVITGKNTLTSLKSSRWDVCFNTFCTDCFLLSHNFWTENIKESESKEFWYLHTVILSIVE